MYRLLQHQATVQFTHILFVCFLWILQQISIISRNNMNIFVLIKDRDFVSSGVVT